jgi:hypothetical protein
MAKFFLLSLKEPLSDNFQITGKNIKIKSWLQNFSLASEIGNQFLLVKLNEKKPESILPYITESSTVNNWVIYLKVIKRLNNEIQISKVNEIINRPLERVYTQVSQEEFNSIVSQMGTNEMHKSEKLQEFKRLEESELLDYIKCYITAKGYYFDDETIYNYHICLKTRPFVILAGLSGTGKSKLSQLYAEAIGHTVQNKRYLRLAVRPNWNDDRYLLGYLNSITGEYITEPAVDFIIEAGEDGENLYFFCLDEMNLAHVEYYFSQFLSALEEDNPSDRYIPLMSERNIVIPTNLLFIGTINVDETTQPLSDKVIDRANTIEFFTVELDKIPDRKPLPDQIVVSAATWHNYITCEPDSTYRTQINEIGKILNKADLGLGYRVLRDIELYLANSKNLLQPVEAFDLQVKQRILPRVRGTETIRLVLDELTTFMKRNNLIRSEKRLDEMKVRLKRDGYTNFWR